VEPLLEHDSIRVNVFSAKQPEAHVYFRMTINSRMTFDGDAGWQQAVACAVVLLTWGYDYLVDQQQPMGSCATGKAMCKTP
jgi:hypothetical protein